MSEKFDLARATEVSSRKDEREQKRIDQMGKRLARHAIRQANKGHIDTPVVAHSEARFSPLKLVSLTTNPSEVYDVANQHLEEQGLRVNLNNHADGLAETSETMTIQIIDKSEPAQKITVRRPHE